MLRYARGMLNNKSGILSAGRYRHRPFSLILELFSAAGELYSQKCVKTRSRIEVSAPVVLSTQKVSKHVYF